MDRGRWSDSTPQARKPRRSEFTCRAEVNGSSFGPDATEHLVQCKWTYMDGYLTRWRRVDLDDVLLELVPAKVTVEDYELDEIVPESAAFISFPADTRPLDLGSDDPEKLLAHLAQISAHFVKAMADPTRYSVGEQLWLEALGAGVDLSDEETAQTFINGSNARPAAQRDAFGTRLMERARSANRRFNGDAPKASNLFSFQKRHGLMREVVLDH